LTLWKPLSSLPFKAFIHERKQNGGETDWQTADSCLLLKKRKSLFLNERLWSKSYDRDLQSTGSLDRFENKNISFYFEKRSSLLQHWRCSCKLKSRRIGSRPQSNHR
jgi:hypothetical protein